jgi:hypothetical protein
VKGRQCQCSAAEDVRDTGRETISVFGRLCGAVLLTYTCTNMQWGHRSPLRPSPSNMI